LNRDQVIGWLIFGACVAVAVGYVGLLVAPGSAADVAGVDAETIRFWAVAMVVLIGFLGVLFLGAWIGWTLATTPPPKPLEELQREIEAKLEKSQEEGVKSKVTIRQ